MAYKWARWLPDAVRAEGCKVAVAPGFANNGRYRSDGRRDLPPNWDFEPNGLSHWHHTGTKSSTERPMPTLDLLLRGRSDLPGPLSQGGIARNGVVHLLAAGRANHAGEFSGAGPTARGADGNTYSIGWEIDTDGTQKMTVAQYRSAIRCAAAVNRRFKRPAAFSLGHAETSVTGKWDPGENGKTVNLDAWRRDLAECLSYPPGVWMSPQGQWSWGEVKVSELREGGEKDSIRRLQRRIKSANPHKVPARLRKAVKANGTWDEATVAAVAAWQKNVFAPSTPGADDGYQDGKRLGPRQAEVLFGRRYHLKN